MSTNNSSSTTSALEKSTSIKIDARYNLTVQMMSQTLPQRVETFMQIQETSPLGNAHAGIDTGNLEEELENLIQEKEDAVTQIESIKLDNSELNHKLVTANNMENRRLRNNEEETAVIVDKLKTALKANLEMLHTLTGMRSQLTRDIDKLMQKSKDDAKVHADANASLVITFQQLFAKEMNQIAGNRILGSKGLPLRQALANVLDLANRRDALPIWEQYEQLSKILNSSKLNDIQHKSGAHGYLEVLLDIGRLVRSHDTRGCHVPNPTLCQSIFERLPISPSGEQPIREKLESEFIRVFGATRPHTGTPLVGQFECASKSRYDIAPNKQFDRELLELFLSKIHVIVHDATYQLPEKPSGSLAANAAAAQSGRGGGSKADNNNLEDQPDYKALYLKLYNTATAVARGFVTYEEALANANGDPVPCCLHMDSGTHSIGECNVAISLAKQVSYKTKNDDGGRGSGRGGRGGGRDSGRDSGRGRGRGGGRGGRGSGSGRSGGSGGGSKKELTNGANSTSTEDLGHLDLEEF